MSREGRYYDRWSKRVAFYALLVTLMLGLGIVMVLQPSGVFKFAGGFLIVLSFQAVSYAAESMERSSRSSFRYDASASSVKSLSVREPRPEYYSEYQWEKKAERFAQLVRAAHGDHPPHSFRSELKHLSREVESRLFHDQKTSPEGALLHAFSILEDAVAESLAADTFGQTLHLSNRKMSRHKILSELKNRGEDIPPEAIEAFELLWEMRNQVAHEDGPMPSRKTVMKILDATLELEGLLAGRPA